jgi:hypothetical protein
LGIKAILFGGAGSSPADFLISFANFENFFGNFSFKENRFPKNLTTKMPP